MTELVSESKSWFDKVCELNKPFFEKFVEKFENMCNKTTMGGMVDIIVASIKQRLDKGSKTIYVVSEISSYTVVEGLIKSIGISDDVYIYVYPSAVCIDSRVEWNNEHGDKICIEFIQSMNDGIMTKYRKDTFNKCPDSFIIDVATTNEDIFYDSIVPLMDKSDISFIFIALDR